MILKHSPCMVGMLTMPTNKTLKHLNSFKVYFSRKTHQNPTQTVSKSNIFIIHCNSQITNHGKNGDITKAESLFNRMPFKTPVSYTAMLTAYAQNGHILKARKMFEEMPQRTLASYNAMITAYTKCNCMVDEAFALFLEMGERNPVSYGAMITGFVYAGMLCKAEELYREMPVGWRDPVCSNALISGYVKAGSLEDGVRVFDGMKERDVVSWSCIVDGYCKEGRIHEARKLFDMMVERNVVTWSSLINGYMNLGCFEDGFLLFLSMRREGGVEVNSNTLTIMCEACGRVGGYGEGIQIHGLVFRMGFEYDAFLSSSVLTMYCRFGCMDEANKMFQAMANKDPVSWNSLIAGYVENTRIDEANRIFELMPQKDMVSWTTMMTGFLKAGYVERAVQLFCMIPEKDHIAWTALIEGFVSLGQFEEAFCWYVKMLKSPVRPNAVTLCTMLGASAGLATISQGMQIHAYAVKLNMESDASFQNSLVSMYSKCGNLVEAYGIFTSIKEPSIISFNSMIAGLSQNGMGEEALDLFSKMENTGCKPNDITFLSVLSACSHAGLVEVGWKYFNSMRSVYDIEPGPDQYACIVDLLGRAGLLDDAIGFINTMPFEPHSVVWETLLGASKMHCRLDIAKYAAEHLTKLEPENATPYVTLCNLYNMAGKMEDEDQLRMIKKQLGIMKSPSSSWITSSDKVRVFHSANQSHSM